MILSTLLWLIVVAAAGTFLVEAWLPWRDRTDLLERTVLTLGLGYAWCVVAGLAMNATPWGVGGGALYAATFTLAAIVTSVQRRRGGQACGRPRPLDRRTWLAVAAVIAFAALFRLPNLGWSEFQGDEALVLHKAAATIDGRHDAIYVHKKGPAEILVTAEVYAMDDRIDEGTARLPFALAMLAGLAAMIVVGRGLFEAKVGLVAALILSLNGFFIAFGRVVQYQALVFMFGTLALWCAWRYRHAEDDAPRWLLLSALFLACGLLSHYDAALVAPAVGYLVVARWRAVPGSLRRERWAVAASFTLGTVLLAAFYVPLVRHPYFQSTTLKYLVDVRLGGGGGEGGGAPYNALPRWAGLANFYNYWLYLLVLGFFVAAAVAKRLIAYWPRAGAWLTIFGIAAVPALLLRPQWFALTNDVEGRSWAIIVVAALAILPLIAGRRDTAWTTVWLWFAVPFVFYATLVESPRTHFHTVFPALSMLAAVAIVAVYPLSGRFPDLHPWRFISPTLGITFLYATVYAWQIFVQHDVAYKREYPHVTAALASWYPFPDLPASGWFGFPYRAGWKAIGAQMQVWGGDYDSNEEPAVTAWYTRGAPRCGEGASWLFVADKVQDVQPLLSEEEPRDVPPGDDEIAAAGFTKVGAISAGSPNGIALWHSNDDPLDWQVGSLSPDETPDSAWGTRATQFDHVLSGPHYDAGLPFDQPTRIVDEIRDDVFGQDPTLALRGWRMDAKPRVEIDDVRDDYVMAGSRIVVSLAWTALTGPIPPNAQVFVHLEREGERTVGQADGPLRPSAETVCRQLRALSSLAPGEAVLDRRVIDIPTNALPGTYDVLVGIYNYETGERLPVSKGPDSGQNRVRITSLRVVDLSLSTGAAP